MNILKRLSAPVICLLLALTSTIVASAHGYWLELEGQHKAGSPVTVKLIYGDYPDGERESGKELDKMKDIKVIVKAPGGAAKQLAMQQTDSFWVGTFTPGESGVYEVTGLNDEREVQDWTKYNLGITRPIQYLKACYAVGNNAAQCAATMPLDAAIRKSGDGYEITLTQAAKPVASQKMFFSSFGKKSEVLTTDAAGKATAKPGDDGLYILSIDWVDNTPGSFRGKSYENVRHRLDYSIYHSE